MSHAWREQEAAEKLDREIEKAINDSPLSLEVMLSGTSFNDLFDLLQSESRSFEIRKETNYEGTSSYYLAGFRSINPGFSRLFRGETLEEALTKALVILRWLDTPQGEAAVREYNRS